MTQSLCVTGLRWGHEISINLCIAAITQNFASRHPDFRRRKVNWSPCVDFPHAQIVEANEDHCNFLWNKEAKASRWVMLLWGGPVHMSAQPTLGLLKKDSIFFCPSSKAALPTPPLVRLRLFKWSVLFTALTIILSGSDGNDGMVVSLFGDGGVGWIFPEWSRGASVATGWISNSR